MASSEEGGLTIDSLKEKLKKLTQPVNDKLKEVKEGADEFLNDNVNVPLAQRGYPKLGAGLAAAGSSAVDFAVPDSVEEGALQLAAGPIGKIAGKATKLGRLGMLAEKEAPKALALGEKAVAQEIPKAEGALQKLTYPGSTGMAERVAQKKELSLQREAAAREGKWDVVKKIDKMFDSINSPKSSQE